MVQIVIVAEGVVKKKLPTAKQIPKCMVEINGKPLLQHHIEHFKEKGYTDFIFCVAHLAEKVKEFFGDGSQFGVSIKYVEETKEPMGTAGSVKLAEPLINEKDFIVYYGDNLTSIDMGKFLKFHRTKHSLATVALRPTPSGDKTSSIILLDPNSKVKLLLEKPTAADFDKYSEEKMFINTGIYAFTKDIFQYIPPGQKYDFVSQLFPRLMGYNESFFGYPATEFFSEIG